MTTGECFEAWYSKIEESIQLLEKMNPGVVSQKKYTETYLIEMNGKEFLFGFTLSAALDSHFKTAFAGASTSILKLNQKAVWKRSYIIKS